MKHLSDGILRSMIDGELTGPEREVADRHVTACSECRERLVRIERESGQIAARLATLAPEPLAAEETAPALAQLRLRVESGAEIPRNRFAAWFMRHPAPAWGGAAIAALVILLIALAPVRSAAQRVLAMLRVQKLAVVPVDLPSMPNRAGMERIRQLMSSRITETLTPGKPVTASGAGDASRLVGFTVRTLTGVPGATQISVTGEQAFVMTLDRARLQEILNDLGRPDLQIPAQVDGETIAVHIPKAAFLRYGDCTPPRRSSSSANAAQPQQNPGSGEAGCIRLAEVPSPIVSVPPGLNINQLAEVVLQAMGMSPDAAAAFCQTVDWQSTLVIPIPGNAASYQQEEVDGVEGSLILGPPSHGQPGHFALIWVKNGIIYSVMGRGNPERALALAGNLS